MKPDIVYLKGCEVPIVYRLVLPLVVLLNVYIGGDPVSPMFAWILGYIPMFVMRCMLCDN